MVVAKTLGRRRMSRLTGLCLRCGGEILEERRIKAARYYCTDGCRVAHRHKINPGKPLGFSLPKMVHMAIQEDSPNEWLQAICVYVAETARPAQ